MAAPVHLELTGIEKAFGATTVLRGVSLSAGAGEFIALLGPSGCGKSTLLRIVAGLEQPDSGRVVLAGTDVTTLRAAHRDMAMVFQSYALYPHLTARQNMALPLVMRRLSRWQRTPFVGRLLPGTRATLAAIRTDVEDAAHTLQIDALLDRKPGQMSGGQRQRVALGRALVRHPKAFLMDEPLSNLDASLRVHTRTEIVDLHRRAGVTTLYVTHDQEEALSMADRVAVMMGGRLLQIAAPEEIYREPAHLDVACFIGSPRINLLAAHVTRDGFAEHGGQRLAADLSGQAGQAVTLAFRPEAVELHEAARPQSVAATVTRVEFLGAEALVHLSAEADGAALVVRQSPQAAQRHAVAGARRHLVARDILVFGPGGGRVHRETIDTREAAHG